MFKVIYYTYIKMCGVAIYAIYLSDLYFKYVLLSLFYIVMDS
jgi:hypothetical protein